MTPEEKAAQERSEEGDRIKEEQDEKKREGKAKQEQYKKEALARAKAKGKVMFYEPALMANFQGTNGRKRRKGEGCRWC